MRSSPTSIEVAQDGRDTAVLTEEAEQSFVSSASCCVLTDFFFLKKKESSSFRQAHTIPSAEAGSAALRSSYRVDQDFRTNFATSSAKPLTDLRGFSSDPSKSLTLSYCIDLMP